MLINQWPKNPPISQRGKGENYGDNLGKSGQNKQASRLEKISMQKKKGKEKAGIPQFDVLEDWGEDSVEGRDLDDLKANLKNIPNPLSLPR